MPVLAFLPARRTPCCTGSDCLGSKAKPGRSISRRQARSGRASDDGSLVVEHRHRGRLVPGRAHDLERAVALGTAGQIGEDRERGEQPPGDKVALDSVLEILRGGLFDPLVGGGHVEAAGYRALEPLGLERRLLGDPLQPRDRAAGAVLEQRVGDVVGQGKRADEQEQRDAGRRRDCDGATTLAFSSPSTRSAGRPGIRRRDRAAAPRSLRARRSMRPAGGGWRRELGRASRAPSLGDVIHHAWAPSRDRGMAAISVR